MKNSDENRLKVYIESGEKTIAVDAEIADDSEERARGLMFRENLDENAGMFFIFEDEAYLSFWMKNTLIPLDMIFIGKNLEIVEVKNAVPCKEDPCLLYESKAPAKYVLEVNYGFAAKNDIGAGDKVVLNQ